MKNINIDDGREAITINGDPNRTIYVQASDFNIKVRARQAQKNIGALLEEIDKARMELDSVGGILESAIIGIFGRSKRAPLQAR